VVLDPIGRAEGIPVKKDKSRGGRSRLGITTQSDLEDRSSALIQIELKTWAEMSSEMRIEQLQALNARYHELLDELYVSANLCVDRYQSFFRAHTKWRWTLILGTGFMAVINLLAAHKRIRDAADALFSADGLFALAAAICAVVLAILANLESFSNSLEKAEGYRESRDLFLDVAREFDRRWDVYVRPLGDSPEACTNATELYRQLATLDRELRAKFKELTKTEARAPRRES